MSTMRIKNISVSRSAGFSTPSRITLPSPSIAFDSSPKRNTPRRYAKPIG